MSGRSKFLIISQRKTQNLNMASLLETYVLALTETVVQSVGAAIGRRRRAGRRTTAAAARTASYSPSRPRAVLAVDCHGTLEISAVNLPKLDENADMYSL